MGVVIKIRPYIRCCFECVHGQDVLQQCTRTWRHVRHERSPRGACGPIGLFLVKRTEERRDA